MRIFFTRGDVRGGLRCPSSRHTRPHPLGLLGIKNGVRAGLDAAAATELRPQAPGPLTLFVIFPPSVGLKIVLT